MAEDRTIITIGDLGSLSTEATDKLKWAIQTDLFFLANQVLRNPKAKPLLDKVHGGICRTLIQKSPNVPLEEWSPIKERVILSSRGTLKSTIKAADLVQLVLCDRNIRIILMSGKLSLAMSNLRMARGYFESNEVLGRLFPEFCTEIQVNAKEFTTPARTGVNYRDPTMQVATFGSVKAGIHAEYIDLDDCTNEVNCANLEQVEKTIQHYDDLDPLLEPGGYITFTGTRWAADDLPEYIKRNGEEMKEETGRDHVLYFFQPIWKVKKSDDQRIQTERDEREKKHRLIPEDVDLLWPEKLSAQYLWPKYRKNPLQFACQYLLNPEAVTSGAFTHQLLVRQTKKLEECPLPHRSITCINWDLAGVSGRGDYAVGIVGIWEDTGRLYIIDAIIEKFTSSTQIASAILRLFKKYNPDYHRIESANGAELLSGELLNLAKKMELGRAFHPGWDAPSNVKDAKTIRIRLLAGALERNQLQFFQGIDCLSELYQQFEMFTGKSSGKTKDDGPDCVAQMYEKWKDGIGPRAVQYLTPSGATVDFQSELPVSKDEPDPHQEERQNADIEFLSRFTVPHAGL